MDRLPGDGYCLKPWVIAESAVGVKSKFPIEGIEIIRNIDLHLGLWQDTLLFSMTKK